MSIINRDWSRLKQLLAESDPKIIEDKKIGIDKTLVISIQDLRYDSSIPILREIDLERWMDCRKNGKPFSRESDEDPKDYINNYKDPNIGQEKGGHQSNENHQLHEVVLNEENAQERPQDLQLVDNHKSDDIRSYNHQKPDNNHVSHNDEYNDPDNHLSSDNQQEADKNPEPDDHFEPENQQEEDRHSQDSIRFTDELVINEPEDDEFAKFKDDDDDQEETLMSRNLKKIRSNVTIPPSNANLPKKKNIVTKSPIKPNIQQTNINKTSTPKKSPIKKAVPPPEPKEPAKPNWLETDKYIQQNQLEIAFRDLDHFKDHINSDELAKPLLLELVKKCLQEDETRVLDESLNLIYNLDMYTHEVEFWSELVLRLKRKLIVYDNVKNFNFKTKANATQVHDNYKRVLINFSEHAKKINQTFKLPLQAMLFLLEPLKFLEPEQFKPPIDIKPKVEHKKVVKEDHQQNSENIDVPNPSTNGHPVLNQTTFQNNIQANGFPNSNQDNQSADNPSKNPPLNNNDRKVSLIKNKFGKESFKIVMTRTTNLSEPSTSSSLHNQNGGNIFARRL